MMISVHFNQGVFSSKDYRREGAQKHTGKLGSTSGELIAVACYVHILLVPVSSATSTT